MGEGDIPLRMILQALAKMKYTGFISYEWEKRNYAEDCRARDRVAAVRRVVEEERNLIR